MARDSLSMLFSILVRRQAIHLVMFAGRRFRTDWKTPCSSIAHVSWEEGWNRQVLGEILSFGKRKRNYSNTGQQTSVTHLHLLLLLFSYLLLLPLFSPILTHLPPPLPPSTPLSVYSAPSLPNPPHPPCQSACSNQKLSTLVSVPYTGPPISASTCLIFPCAKVLKLFIGTVQWSSYVCTRSFKQTMI